MEQIEQAVKASYALLDCNDATADRILTDTADALLSGASSVLAANAEDLSRMTPDHPKYDRLQLTEKRLEDMANDMRQVAALPSPLGKILFEVIRPNGMYIKKVSVPFGVIGVIYEARPNVTFDVFSLCLKSGNACLLKGGSDA
ncbi:MAG: gamma-glutamyl-phosphate reductase, partial [Dysgonamonadaceae bacterium]|nr:gamma-glutamyl-phosphate reductase [Dysgonamonadaceae bacterium]